MVAKDLEKNHVLTPLPARKNLENIMLTGAKKPPDESERGERNSWLKAQHSENEDHGIWSRHFMGTRRGNRGNSAMPVSSPGGSRVIRRWGQNRRPRKNLNYRYREIRNG